MHNSQLQPTTGQPLGLFIGSSMIVFPEPVVEFAGRFDADGQPVLVTNSIPRAVPVTRPQAGQVCEGHWLAQVRSVRSKAYLVLDTTTMPLAFEYDSATALRPWPGPGSLIRLEAVPVSSPSSNPRFAWLIYQQQPDQIWALSNPQTAEQAERCGAFVQACRPPVLTLNQIHSETHWLEMTRKDLLPEDCQTLSWGDALNRARIQLLGEPYRKAQRNECYSRVDLVACDQPHDHASNHPGQTSPRALDKNYARVKAAHERCWQKLNGIEAAAAHPKLAALIEETARNFMTRYRAIDERLKVLGRLETTVTPPSSQAGVAGVQSQQAALVQPKVSKAALLSALRPVQKPAWARIKPVGHPRRGVKV